MSVLSARIVRMHAVIFPIAAPESHVETCAVCFAKEQMVRKRAPVRPVFLKIARNVRLGIQMKNVHVILKLPGAQIAATMKAAFPVQTTRMKTGTLCVRVTTEAEEE